MGEVKPIHVDAIRVDKNEYVICNLIINRSFRCYHHLDRDKVTLVTKKKKIEIKILEITPLEDGRGYLYSFE